LKSLSQEQKDYLESLVKVLEGKDGVEENPSFETNKDKKSVDSKGKKTAKNEPKNQKKPVFGSEFEETFNHQSIPEFSFSENENSFDFINPEESEKNKKTSLQEDYKPLNSLDNFGENKTRSLAFEEFKQSKGKDSRKGKSLTKKDSHLLSKGKYNEEKRKGLFLKASQVAVGLIPLFLMFVVVFNQDARMFASQFLPFLKPGIELNMEGKAFAEEEYNTWASKYISEAEDRVPEIDFSKDGLSNLESYYLGIDPSNPDINDNGKLNGQDLLESIDPVNGKFIDESQRGVISKYVNKERVVYRLQAYTLQGNLTDSEKGDFETLSDLTVKNINPENKGLLSIDYINMEDVEVLWQFSEAKHNFKDEILLSLIHYEESRMPAIGGNAYVFGSIQKMKDLQLVEPNSKIKLKVMTEDGENKLLTYYVTGKNIFDPTDYTQFESRKYSELSIATPIDLNTSTKVLVVKAKLVSVETLEVEEEVSLEVKETEVEVVEETVEDKQGE
jgi:sortase (surface protein transpeptidase)